MRDLEGKVCVVTGAGSGIGRALAQRLSSHGMRVVAADIDDGAVAKVVDDLVHRGGDAVGLRCDVTAPDQVEALRTGALDAYGEVDLVCLNAGVATVGSLTATTLEEWRWMFDVNVFGVVHGIRSFVPYLTDRGSGHIVVTASTVGLVDTPTMGAYSASKHAVIGIVGALRNEIEGSGVGLSVLCPGLVNTNFLSGDSPPANDEAALVGPAYRDALGAAQSPDDVAARVHRAVLDDQFIVFTNAEFDPGLDGRALAIADGRQWRDSSVLDRSG